MILPVAVQYRGQIIRKDNIRYLEKLLVLAVTRGSSVTSVRICKMNAVTFVRKQGNREVQTTSTSKPCVNLALEVLL